MHLPIWLQSYYGIKRKPITTRNPQANAIIECVQHQTIGNVFQKFDLNEVDEDDPWTGMLAATSFTAQAIQATPAQELMFGHDAILNIKHVTDWEHVHQRKQEIIRKNNRKEN
jgi:hypothetical protein